MIDVYLYGPRNENITFFSDNTFLINSLLEKYNQTSITNSFWNVLNDSKNRNSDNFLIFCHTSSSCVSNSKTLASNIQNIINTTYFDICYLNRANAKIESLPFIYKINRTINMFEIFELPDIHAVLISPSGRDKILSLNKYKYDKSLTVYTISPNLISFDISKVQNMDDYTKLNEFNPHIKFQNSTSSYRSLTVFWIVCIVTIFVILIVLFFAN